MTNPVAILRTEVRYQTKVPVGKALWVWCPACDGAKRLPIEGSRPSWEWNGNLEKPTLTPSILQIETQTAPRCHSYLTEGVWNYLSDCTHDMPDRQVPMVPVPDFLALGLEELNKKENDGTI